MIFEKGITIIGTGNVAWHLAVAFFKANIRLSGIVGRNSEKAKELADYVKCSYSDDIGSAALNADLVLLCVNDTSIKTISGQINSGITPIVHTSGSVDMEILGEHDNFGVFYPFQTFTRGVHLGEVNFPVCLEASNEQTSACLSGLAEKVALSINYMGSAERRKLHLAGIMANNFSNILFTKAYSYLSQKSLDPLLLQPLIEETAKKLAVGQPEDLQTGPARRGDDAVIKQHAELLEDTPELRDIYINFSNIIRSHYKTLHG